MLQVAAGYCYCNAVIVTENTLHFLTGSHILVNVD